MPRRGKGSVMVRHGLAAALVAASVVSSRLAAASEGAEERDRRAEDKRGGVDVGVLGGVGFPRPFALEAGVRFDETWMVGAEYGFLPKTTISNVDAKMWEAAAVARWFPFHGAFFFGLRGGFQSLSGDATLSAAQIGSYTESVEVGSWFLNPRVGFLWTWKPVALGIDVGVQIPIATTVSRSSLLAVDAPNVDAQITSATNLLGRTVLPTVDLLKIGLVF